MSPRRFALYFSWTVPLEGDRPLGELDDRYPTLFELRRFDWPHFERLAGGDQQITGFLSRVVLGDFEPFRNAIADATGIKPPILERVAADGSARALDTALLAVTDTLVVISLDHFRSALRPTDAEISAVRDFLERPEACLVVCPHHNVGEPADPAHPTPDDLRRQVQEHEHHGDALVPARQQIGAFARNLLAALELPITHRYGLRPATLD